MKIPLSIGTLMSLIGGVGSVTVFFIMHFQTVDAALMAEQHLREQISDVKDALIKLNDKVDQILLNQNEKK